MATFKAVVSQHQRRNDGTYPVSIRVTNNRESAYISTGLYVSLSQINKKTFEIKDQPILVWTGQAIAKYKERLLSLTLEELNTMSAKQLKDYLSIPSAQIDFLEFCRNIRDNEPETVRGLGAVVMAFEEMGYTKLPIKTVNNALMEKFREYIDNKTWINKEGKTRTFAASTKNTMLGHIVAAHRLLKKRVNTDYSQVITNELVYEPFKKELVRKRTMKDDALVKFINYVPDDKIMQVTKDLSLISFGCCGINLKDLLLLKRSCYDAETGRLVFQRAKTTVITSFVIPTQTRKIMGKYLAKKGDLLFDFGSYNKYKNFNSRHLYFTRKICDRIGIDYISLYWFRHTWSSIARNNCGASKDDVDMCLCHVGEHPMADVYIDADWKNCDILAQAVQDYVEKISSSFRNEEESNIK